MLYFSKFSACTAMKVFQLQNALPVKVLQHVNNFGDS